MANGIKIKEIKSAMVIKSKKVEFSGRLKNSLLRDGKITAADEDKINRKTTGNGTNFSKVPNIAVSKPVAIKETIKFNKLPSNILREARVSKFMWLPETIITRAKPIFEINMSGG